MSSKRPLEPEDHSESTFRKLKRITGNPSGPPTSQPSAQQDGTGSAHPVWAKCTNTLRMLEKCSSVVPSLQPVVKTIIECIKDLSDTNKRRQEFCDLASDLADLIDILIKHLEQTSSEMISNCLTNIVNALEEDLTRIKNQQQQSRLSRIGRAEQNEDDLIKYYRKIEKHIRRLQANASLGMWSSMHEHIANSRLNQLLPAMQARYDSAQSSKSSRRTCNPNTRVAVLADMHGWSNSPDSPKLYWMNGMAGTGKTTIAYSLCDMLKNTCQLGASFFCSRLLPECRDVNRIMPTIAYQLARFSLPFQSALCAVLASDPDIGRCDLRKQFDNLVMGPLLAAKESMPANVVVVIDALDECAGSSGTRTILDLLFYHAAALPIKIFVTSRPEPTISGKMQALDDRSRSIFVLHEIEKTIVQSDIETYLSSELSLLSPLPTEDQVRRLAKQAGSLFIYAATALRYICPENPIIDSHSRLLKMLQLVPGTHDRMHNEIDVLYTAILDAISLNLDLEPECVENIWIVLRTVICLMEPMTTKALAGLLGLKDEHEMMRMIKPLESVLHISSSTALVSTLHASFPDFLLSQQRSGKHFCDRTEHNHLLVQHCFKTMRRSLRFNICDLESSFVLDSDIADPGNRIGDAITPELLYTCRYWADHLLESAQAQELTSLVVDFLRCHLLFWMETMNLKGCISACALILSRAHGWLVKHDANTELSRTCKEAQRFVTVFATSPISQSTPHIYVSLLSFWDKKSVIWELYGKWRRVMVKVDGPATRRKSANLAVWKTGVGVESVAFSPNGNHVVSGSHASTIRVWDAQSGRAVAGPFEGHRNGISSVVFSPDGTRVASGSRDRTIRIWDAQSGRVIAGPFEGHADGVSSVAFSPDGARIVSSSIDKTIRIWDAQSGRVVAGPFEGHTSWITSAVFSPDGARVVSASQDRTIRIWDAQNGHIIAGPFEGHTDGVASVAFSPDGAQVVSGSDDWTIRIWDVHSGRTTAGSFEGHTDRISSVKPLLDSACVVSSPHKETIQTWDAQGGHVIAGLFEGHTSSFGSALFSLEDAQIVSRPNTQHTHPHDTRSFDTGHHTEWKINSDGWLVDNSFRILLWLPTDLREVLKRPHNSVIISQEGCCSVDFESALIGPAWNACFLERFTGL